MKILIKLAWRNIWRNWRRSLITITAIVFAVILSVLMRGMQHGTYQANIKMSVELFTGYLQLQRQGYNENPSLRKTFKPSDELINLLNHPKVKSYSKRVYSGGLVSTKTNTSGALIFAIDPRTEKSVSNFYTKIKEGNFIDDANHFDVVVGSKMMKNLGLNLGDSVVILTSGYDGSMGNHKFRICGSFSMGFSEFDGMAIFMHIRGADELISLDGRISSIVVSLDDINSINTVKSDLNTKFGDLGFTLLDWTDLMPDMKQLIELDDISGIIYLGILMLVVAFGILNTVLMSVTERFREFGVMIALGTKQSELVKVLFIEVVLLLLISLGVGIGISYLLNYIFYLNPISLSGEFAQIYEEYGFIPQIETTMDSFIFTSTALSVMIMSAFAFIYPAYRVYKLEALKGIRYT
jgi:putative ABC transport system permease protein